MEKDIINWLKFQLKKCRKKGFVLGLSGGLDSSFTAYLCKKATNNVLGLILPCQSRKKDIKDALYIAKKFNINTKIIDLTKIFENYIKLLPYYNKMSVVNIKPRLRMITLYYFANALDYLVVGTGNKSELKVGYFTKYGDGGVDLLPLGNLYKTEIKVLAEKVGIPERIINKPPSAGLWQGQTDEKELGITYTQLDRILLSLEKGKKIRNKKLKDINNIIKQTKHKLCVPAIFRKS